MDNCIFCKIIKGIIPCTKVYEDNNCLAFLDISPVNKGHTLVIPKKHYETILDIPEEALKELIAATKKVAEAIHKGMDCPGFCVLQSNFKAGGQEVPHLHFHIVPRLNNDGLKFWPQGKYAEGEADNYALKIKKEIKNNKKI
jgi:histidine triad (HIT) family protein